MLGTMPRWKAFSKRYSLKRFMSCAAKRESKRAWDIFDWIEGYKNR